MQKVRCTIRYAGSKISKELDVSDDLSLMEIEEKVKAYIIEECIDWDWHFLKPTNKVLKIVNFLAPVNK